METLDELLERLQRDVDRAFKYPDLSNFVVPVYARDLQSVLDYIEKLKEDGKQS